MSARDIIEALRLATPEERHEISLIITVGLDWREKEARWEAKLAARLGALPDRSR